MKTVNLRPHLKRNILIAAVLLLVCAAAFLNWSYNQRWGDGNSAMADAEDEMTTAVNAADGAPEETVSASARRVRVRVFLGSAAHASSQEIRRFRCLKRRPVPSPLRRMSSTAP